jgi:hypothetical protein
LNRSIPFFLQPQVSRPELRTFNHVAQQWGTYLRGFPWQFFCTGTYSHKMSLNQTEVSLRAFFDRLGRGLGRGPRRVRVAYVAVRERRTSGLGLPAIAAHWHFMFAVPDWHQTRSAELAKALWRPHNGKFDIRRYNAEDCATFYVSKLAGGAAEFEPEFDNLGRLAYTGPQDLYQAQQLDPYVPDHVKHRTFGETLVLRSL